MLSISSIEEQFDAIAYLTALSVVANADGIADVERDFIYQQAAMLGADLDALNLEELAKKGIESIEATELTRRVILRDCIFLAALDGEYTETERKHVQRLGEMLGISSQLVARIERWAEQYMKLIEESEAILSAE